MPDRVLIVDDHPGFRKAVRALLGDEGYAVVGEAADLASARTAIGELSPDLVVLDIQLPDGDGLAFASELAGVSGSPAVVLVSTREAADYGDRLLRAPSLGFVSKRDLSGDTLRALIGDAPCV